MGTLIQSARAEVPEVGCQLSSFEIFILPEIESPSLPKYLEHLSSYSTSLATSKVSWFSQKSSSVQIELGTFPLRAQGFLSLPRWCLPFWEMMSQLLDSATPFSNRQSEPIIVGFFSSRVDHHECWDYAKVQNWATRSHYNSHLIPRWECRSTTFLVFLKRK